MTWLTLCPAGRDTVREEVFAGHGVPVMRLRVAFSAWRMRHRLE